MPAHVMFDLETLGTRPGHVVATLGAVRFDPFGEGVTDKLHVGIDMDAQFKAGMTALHSTLIWWFRQSAEARNSVAEADAISVPGAFNLLSDFVQRGPLKGVWSHGPGFDVAILKALFERTMGIDPPWHYRLERDTRTLFMMAGKPEVIRYNDLGKHNALADAEHQARCVQLSFRKLERDFGWRKPLWVE